MATKTLSNEFMQRIADEGAWKEISGDLCWTEQLLEKYQDKIDWNELSENRNILWTIPMLQKFKYRINWDKLSRYADEKVLTENCIETFKEKWNWNELSSNCCITNELLEKFVDKWDWETVIDDYRSNLFSNVSAIEFHERYKEYIPAAKLQKYIEEGTVQIAPLAYMRGRTLDNAFVILDEAQNTTLSQIKMFLTRMGRNAKFIVTGDVTQIDLPRRSDSGLTRAMETLKNIDGIGIVEFDKRDIVRHRLVKYIVDAFDKREELENGLKTQKDN